MRLQFATLQCLRGRNALALYAGSIWFATWLRHQAPTGSIESGDLYYALGGGFVEALAPLGGTLVFSAVFTLVAYAVACALDQARIYIRL